MGGLVIGGHRVSLGTLYCGPGVLVSLGLLILAESISPPPLFLPPFRYGGSGMLLSVGLLRKLDLGLFKQAGLEERPG